MVMCCNVLCNESLRVKERNFACQIERFADFGQRVLLPSHFAYHTRSSPWILKPTFISLLAFYDNLNLEKIPCPVQWALEIKVSKLGDLPLLYLQGCLLKKFPGRRTRSLPLQNFADWKKKERAKWWTWLQSAFLPKMERTPQATHITMARPTDPDLSSTPPGVTKIPVPESYTNGTSTDQDADADSFFFFSLLIIVVWYPIPHSPLQPKPSLIEMNMVHQCLETQKNEFKSLKKKPTRTQTKTIDPTRTQAFPWNSKDTIISITPLPKKNQSTNQGKHIQINENGVDLSIGKLGQAINPISPIMLPTIRATPLSSPTRRFISSRCDSSTAGVGTCFTLDSSPDRKRTKERGRDSWFHRFNRYWHSIETVFFRAVLFFSSLSNVIPSIEFHKRSKTRLTSDIQTTIL